MNLPRIAVLTFIWLSLTATPALAGPSGRLFLGGAAAQGQTQGTGAVLGYQSAGGAEVTQGYWGLSILGAQMGQGFIPFLSVDGGFRWTPWPRGFLRPYATIGIGATFLLILPVPGVHAAVGIGVPVADAVVFDLTLGARKLFNPFDVNNSPTIATLELGLAL